MSTRAPDPDNSGATREDTLGKETRLDDGQTTPAHETHAMPTTPAHETHAMPTTPAHETHAMPTTPAHETHVMPTATTRDEHVVEHHELHDTSTHDVDRARGGFSFWSVLSGMFVAFGSFIVLSAIIGAIMAVTGLAQGGINASEASTAGIAAAVGLVLAQFLAYLWGGYTAGRMARGSGVLNGIMVPILALVFVALLGGILAAVTGTSPDVAASEAQTQAQSLPLPLDDLAQIGTGVGIGLLVAMLLGGAIGGAMGQRWHRKLEDGETRYTDDRSEIRHS